jgi:hypothetical protein
MPTTVQSQIPPPIQPLINPLEWFILFGGVGVDATYRGPTAHFGLGRAPLLWGESLLPVLVRLATPSQCGITRAV